MRHLKNKENCPCRKGEFCVNGLACNEENCFLLKRAVFADGFISDLPEQWSPFQLETFPMHSEW